MYKALKQGPTWRMGMVPMRYQPSGGRIICVITWEGLYCPHMAPARISKSSVKVENVWLALQNRKSETPQLFGGGQNCFGGAS